ncbi:hypothetical protein SNE40_005890 [Patella caerulea]|uniref:EGF-like domain-containing protein n=1 Tax=Patella caerulea TaxID=87958 RepID=A0AAN8PZ94_PATCE
MTVLLVLLLLLNINSIAPASLHGEEKEHDIFAEINISLSLLLSLCDNIKFEQGGTCVNGQCVCLAKTTGRYCEVSENHCEPNPCYANGKCNQTEEGYVCECSANFLGPNCNVSENHCEPNPCYANGKCNETEEGYVCECSGNFLGPNCNVNIVELYQPQL